MPRRFHFCSIITLLAAGGMIAGCGRPQKAEHGQHAPSAPPVIAKAGGIPAPASDAVSSGPPVPAAVETTTSAPARLPSPGEIRLNEILDRLDQQMEQGITSIAAEDIEEIRKLIGQSDSNWHDFVYGQLPSYLYPYLEQEMIARFEKGLTHPNSSYQTGLLGQIKTPAAAHVLFKALEACPPFIYPEKAPSPWHVDYGHRGAQGNICRALVTNGDPATMQRYYDKLSAATDTNVQRVLLYGLRGSERREDFDFLMKYRKSVNEPMILQHVDCALTTIAATFQNKAANPLDDREAWPDGPYTKGEREQAKQHFAEEEARARQQLEKMGVNGNSMLY